jgi:hypothetical protein
VTIELLKVGHCFHPEAVVIRGGSWRAQQFPAIVALLKHPSQGYMLFDTGYAKHFIQATTPFPQRLYRWVTPMHLCDKENLLHQLAQRGIAPEDIKHIFISHFHADHIAGLLDFPQARYICSKVALQSVMQRSGIRGLCPLISLLVSALLKIVRRGRLRRNWQCLAPDTMYLVMAPISPLHYRGTPMVITVYCAANNRIRFS